MFERESGILVHISSLPSAYGIGDLGIKAYEFVDFLENAEQKLWQVLPIGPTGYGNSPYQSFSSFAGNPYFIDVENLVEEELLEREDIEILERINKKGSINYGDIYTYKFPILRKSYECFIKKNRSKETIIFQKKEKYWLEDYCLFMALKEKFNQKNWNEWSSEYKNREKESILNIKKELKKEIEFYIFLQYIFYKQWKKLKKYANSKNIKIIGDIPIFVASDSSDAWSKSEMFLFDKNKNSTRVAGCPPDNFSIDGQLWGNPLYDWSNIEKNEYVWWVERIKSCFNLHDIVRIDHFRGFESYWSIPANSKTAAKGQWEKGPGIKLFNTIKNSLGDMPIIAEDLGFLTLEVQQLLIESGYPGMKILLFAFDSKEESDYLPHKYLENSVAYTGTHDNETVVGWYENVKKSDKRKCDEYLGEMEFVISDEINWKFIEAVWSSKSLMALTQMQDLLGLDNNSRMNIPSTSSENWQWRFKEEDLTLKLAKRLKKITKKNMR
ncbi:MAG: 4-alpha-glucanotransferase [Fusobacteriaceae bacterium]